MRRFGFISGLKLRASGGTTGNTSISPYQTWGGLDRTRYNFSSAIAAGYRPGAIPNPDLVWERTAKLDAGVDFGLFRDRISGTVDLYRERTSDLLLPRSLPASTGFTQVLQNIGKTENRGWEASITTVNLPGTGGGPRWTTDLSFTHNRNFIVALASGAADDIGNRWFIGRPTKSGTIRRSPRSTRRRRGSSNTSTSATGHSPTWPSRGTTATSPGAIRPPESTG